MHSTDFPKIIELVESLWPSAGNWPEATWHRWFAELDRFDTTLVENRIRRLADDPQFRAFPPGWAVVKTECSMVNRQRARVLAIKNGAESW